MTDEAENDPKPVDLVKFMESARADLALRIGKLVPKTSAAATDIVSILAAIQGTPTSVTIKSPTIVGGQTYNSATNDSGWQVEVVYAKTLTLVTGPPPED